MKKTKEKMNLQDKEANLQDKEANLQDKEIAAMQSAMFERGINEILTEFDYGRVANIMKHVDWKMMVHIDDDCTVEDAQMEIPTERHLRRLSVDMMRSAYAGFCANGRKYYHVGTGPFLVEVFRDEDEDAGIVHIKLLFVAEDWET